MQTDVARAFEAVAEVADGHPGGQVPMSEALNVIATAIGRSEATARRHVGVMQRASLVLQMRNPARLWLTPAGASARESLRAARPARRRRGTQH